MMTGWENDPREPRINGTTSVLFQLGMIITIVCAAVLAFELFVAIFRSPEVFSEIYGMRINILIITPFPVSVLTISGATLQLFYVAVLTMATIAVGYLLWKFIPAFIGFLRDNDQKPMEKNVMFEFSTMFAAMYFLEMAFLVVLIMIGVDVDDSVPFVDETPLEMMFLTLQAAVWEEIVSRVLLIGVPMLVIAFALSDREKLWKWLAGGFGMSQAAAVLIVISALFFGIAHVPGWDLWKFVPTFIFGLGVGYLFVKYGLYAAIAMHFMFNYLSASDWLLNDSGVLIGLAILIVAVLGIPYAWVYAKRGVLYFRNEFIRA